MDEDGIPDFCKLTAEERRQSWKDVPATPMPKFTDPVKAEDAGTLALRAEVERKAAEKQLRENARLAALPKPPKRPPGAPRKKRKPRRPIQRKTRR
jgi:hypothetical protein